jgi:hypothetical protein
MPNPRASRPMLVGRMAPLPQPYKRGSSTNRLHQIAGPWTRPNVRTWPAHYEASTQMVSPPATARPGTAFSWHYHPAEITHPRRFPALPTRNDAFLDSRPDLDAVPATVLREASTLLQWSLSPIPADSMLDKKKIQSVRHSLTLLRP